MNIQKFYRKFLLIIIYFISFSSQKVESQGQQILGTPTKDGGALLQTQNWNDIVSPESSEKMQKVLDSSVDKIAGVISKSTKVLNNIFHIRILYIVVFVRRISDPI